MSEYRVPVSNYTLEIKGDFGRAILERLAHGLVQNLKAMKRGAFTSIQVRNALPVNRYFQDIGDQVVVVRESKPEANIKEVILKVGRMREYRKRGLLGAIGLMEERLVGKEIRFRLIKENGKY